MGRDGVRDRAQTRRGEKHGQRLGPVRELEGDHVAGADAARRQAAREPLGRGGERGEAGARGPLDHGDPGAGPDGSGGEGRPERLATPQAGLAVAIRKRRKVARNGGAQAVLTVPTSPHPTPTWASAPGPVKRAGSGVPLVVLLTARPEAWCVRIDCLRTAMPGDAGGRSLRSPCPRVREPSSSRTTSTA